MSNWYNQDAQSWYQPLERDEGAPEKEKKEKKRKLSTGWKILIGAALCIALIAVSSLAFASRAPQEPEALEPGEEFAEDWHDFFNSFYEAEAEKPGEIRLPRVETMPRFSLEIRGAEERELSLQELYKNCAESIVAISGYVDGSAGFFWGSGIVLSEDGLILTNSHVVENCDSATVTLFDDRSFEAMLVGADPMSDVAVLKIDAKGLKPAVFGDSSKLTVGEHVAAIGNPLGESFRMTLTDGIISAIDRGINYNGHSMTLLQTNTAINEGNSGGALFNMYGQVVGVTNMKMMSSYSSIEGIGFAIPSATLRSVVDSLVQYGEVRGRPAVGITVGAIPANAAEHYDLPGGLYVSAVSEGSDAWAKGIRQGDIVVAVNGEPAMSTEDIVNVKNALQVGDSITFTIWRDGETFDVDVVLTEYNDVY